MPPTTLDETYEPRPWRCGECDRILGVVMRDVHRVRRLWVFTLDRAANDLPPVQILFHAPKGLFRVHGLDCVSRPGGVECSRCGALNDWTPSVESFDRLMSHFSGRKV